MDNYDVRSMFDSRFIYAFHLVDAEGRKRDMTLTIELVEPTTVTSQGKKEERKPLVHFKEYKLPLVLNKTNVRTVSAMYGNDVRKWVGKRITLYPTTCDAFGKETDCIRVRPGMPRDSRKQETEATNGEA